MGSGGGGVFRSQDSGATWTNVGAIGVVRSLAIDRADPLVIYAVTNSGLRKTVDGGATWALLDGLPSLGFK